jgi:transposase
MSAERLGMETIRKILRFYLDHGLRGSRQIAQAAGCSKSAVNRCLERAQKRGVIDWAKIEPLDDMKLEELLGLAAGNTAAMRPLPDWARVDEEMRRRDCDVTLKLIWEEYRAGQPDGYSYTQFWKHFSAWKKKQSLVMRQEHKAGEKSFVDFCDGMFLADAKTGELTKTHLFVGALGASSYTFCSCRSFAEHPALYRMPSADVRGL